MPLARLPWPSDPHLRRWMVFIDGENFAIRAKDFATSRALELAQGPEYEPDVFVWMPETPPLKWLSGTESAQLRPLATRAYYYTSVTGDTERIDAIRRALWDLGFEPDVFKRKKNGEKAKGVDIALSKVFSATPTSTTTTSPF